MSGGHFDYTYRDLNDIIEKLKKQKTRNLKSKKRKKLIRIIKNMANWAFWMAARSFDTEKDLDKLVKKLVKIMEEK
jgi:hypothetical protein